MLTLLVPLVTSALLRPAALPRATAPSMQFGMRPPPEVMGVLEPAYKGAARGGKPMVVGTEKEMVAIWNAMVRVYGSREDALTAVRKNQQVILPYINSPETIIGAHGALVGIFGKAGAAELIRKNPGVLACDPTTLAETPAAEIEKAANFVVWFDGLPTGLKEAIPTLTAFAIVGIVGGRVIACGGDACGTEATWDLQGGLGPQLVRFVSGLLGVQ